MKKILLIILFLLIDSKCFAWSHPFRIEPEIIWNIDFFKRIPLDDSLEGWSNFRITTEMIFLYNKARNKQYTITELTDYRKGYDVSEYILNYYIPEYLESIGISPSLGTILFTYKYGAQKLINKNISNEFSEYIKKYIQLRNSNET